jgi:PTH1 family peptidyl-tRNA hydrolase
MKLIVGLGNPGTRYELTRHNVGFLAVDYLAEEWKASSWTKKFDAEIAQVQRGQEKVILVKPTTFMNLSGKSVAAIYKFYQCEPQDLVVIHDDLDLEPMTLKFKTGGGTGGHNGLKSIDASLGSGQNNYHRIRIGIGKSPFPGSDAADHVLSNLSDSEIKEFNGILPNLQSATEMILDGKIGVAMNTFHKKKETE